MCRGDRKKGFIISFLKELLCLSVCMFAAGPGRCGG